MPLLEERRKRKVQEKRRQKVVGRRKPKVETRSQMLLLLQKKVKISPTLHQLSQRMELSLLKRRKPMPQNLMLPSLKHQKMPPSLTLPSLMHQSLTLPSLTLPSLMHRSLLRRLSLRHQKMLRSHLLASECIL